ncbi:MAG TPA: pirin family protein [Polyangia bacterium]|nr:pirin family protein [Polyangia bacterium]
MSRASRTGWSRREAVTALAGAGVAVGCDKLWHAPTKSLAAASREREVVNVVDAQPTIEGAGVHLRRSLGSRALPLLDPFLMLDEFHSDRPEDYLPGFPSHPHRGFETVTYMLEGAVEHRDSLGNHGHLGPGCAQWMTAGHGIIHSEMPVEERTSPRMWGFQLWVNLPAAKKLIAPRYQDLPPARIPEVDVDDGRIRLVAGTIGGAVGPVSGIVTAPQMFEVKLGRRGSVRHDVPTSHNAFVYVFDGEAQLGPARTKVGAGQLAVLGPGERLVARAETSARLLSFAGAPIGEPVARYGPFVMNTEDELRQAVDDYRSGRLTLL